MDYKIKPWDHQEIAIGIGKQVPHYALFFQMGTGKTATIINILRHKYQTHGALMKTLILGPVAVVENWREEILMHSDMDPAYIITLTGSGKKRVKLLSGAIGHLPNRVVITNYEGLLNRDLLELLYKWQPQVVVCDESHMLKDHKTKRSKAVTALADNAQYKYILTGTPIVNSAMDLFSQFRILDGGATFGQNYFGFRGKYFEDKNAHMPKQKYFPNWVPRDNTYQEFNEMVYRKAMRVKKSECLDLPPFIRQKLRVEMGTDQAKAYKEMKDSFVAFLDQDHGEKPKAAIAQYAMTKALRLQQIVSGYITLDDGTTHRFKEVPRIRELKTQLRELTPEHKVIVWATFKENYAMIREVCKELGIEYTELTGEVSNATNKQANLKTFEEDDKCRVMIANQSAGGVGVNMVAASYSIYFSRGFSLVGDEQSEARNYRGGSEQHSSITRIDLVATDTIDIAVLKALSDKKNISELILGWRDDV